MPTYIVIPKTNLETGIAQASVVTRKDLIDRREHILETGIVKRLRTEHSVRFSSEPLVSGAGAANEGIRTGESARRSVYVRSLPGINVLLVSASSDIAESLSGDPDVDIVVPADQHGFIVPRPDALSATSSNMAWHLGAVRAEVAHKNSFTGRGVWIGFADTGVDASHSEFNGRKIAFAEFDAVGGMLQTNPYDADAQGHGTHVVGIACGKTVGVAPDSEIAMALVLGNILGISSPDQVLNGLDWLARGQRPDGSIGVDILNLSMVTVDPLHRRAVYATWFKGIINFVRRLGIEVIAAIGNDGPNTHGSPGNYDDVIGIGAIDEHDQLWPRTSFGTVSQEGNLDKPDFVAPGVDICSAAPGGGYALKSGTSMATPAAAGVAALIIQECGPSAILRNELNSRSVAINMKSPNRQINKISY